MTTPAAGTEAVEVSVVIPARNEAQYIGACVESIKALSGEGRAEILS